MSQRYRQLARQKTDACARSSETDGESATLKKLLVAWGIFFEEIPSDNDGLHGGVQFRIPDNWSEEKRQEFNKALRKIGMRKPSRRERQEFEESEWDVIGCFRPNKESSGEDDAVAP